MSCDDEGADSRILSIGCQLAVRGGASRRLVHLVSGCAAGSEVSRYLEVEVRQSDTRSRDSWARFFELKCLGILRTGAPVACWSERP